MIDHDEKEYEANQNPYACFFHFFTYRFRKEKHDKYEILGMVDYDVK